MINYAGMGTVFIFERKRMCKALKLKRYKATTDKT